MIQQTLGATGYSRRYVNGVSGPRHRLARAQPVRVTVTSGTSASCLEVFGAAGKCSIALERVAADDRTQVIVLLSKPAAHVVATSVLLDARAPDKPMVVNSLGAAPRENADNLVFADRLEATAILADALARSI